MAKYRKTKKEMSLCGSNKKKLKNHDLMTISINLLVVYRESINLIGYITRRSARRKLGLVV